MRRLQRFYAFFWSRTSGRPYTYGIRDWSARHPKWAGAIISLIIAGVLATQVLSFFLAFLAGHLFWDTAGAYIPRRRDG